jgi:hypothetical protein
VLLLGLLGIKSTASIIVFCILYGFFSGGVVALIGPVITSLAAEAGEIGTRMGLTFFVMSFGSLFGTPIQGALLGTTYIWWRAIVFLAIYPFSPSNPGNAYSVVQVFVLVGSLCILYARFMMANRRGSQKV